jgi:hypothetical protein
MRRQSRRSLTLAALIGAWLAAACNYLLYLVYYAAGIIPWNMLSPGRGVSIRPLLVLFVSVGGALGGALLYAIIEKVSATPVRTFKLIAGVILILSFAAPFMIGTFTTALMVGLDLMHIVVFASTFWALTVWRQGSAVKASV